MINCHERHMMFFAVNWNIFSYSIQRQQSMISHKIAQIFHLIPGHGSSFTGPGHTNRVHCNKSGRSKGSDLLLSFYLSPSVVFFFFIQVFGRKANADNRLLCKKIDTKIHISKSAKTKLGI